MKNPSDTTKHKPAASSTLSIMADIRMHVAAWQDGLLNLAEAVDRIDGELAKLKLKLSPTSTLNRGNTTAR
jgi:hypothetical protein